MTANGRWKSDSWLDERLERLEALYQRFGKDGLTEFADAHLLLWSKQIEMRDEFQGRKLEPAELAYRQRLELEIKDLAGYLADRQKERQPVERQQTKNKGMQRHQPQQALSKEASAPGADLTDTFQNILDMKPPPSPSLDFGQVMSGQGNAGQATEGKPKERDRGIEL
jgi:hypothetical protein